MLKKHDFGKNSKVVQTQHDTSKGGSAGPGNDEVSQSSFNPATGPGTAEGGNFCDGGAKYDDGGLIDRAGSKVADMVENTFGTHQGGAKRATPPAPPTSAAQAVGISAGNKDAPYQGSGGAAAQAALDAKERSME